MLCIHIRVKVKGLTGSLENKCSLPLSHLSSSEIYLPLFMCTGVSGCVGMHMCVSALTGQKRTSGAWELELQALVNHPIWGLEPEFWSFTKIAHAFDTLTLNLPNALTLQYSSSWCSDPCYKIILVATS